MSTLRQISCINKTNRADRHHRISHVGGMGWAKITEDDAIKNIRDGIYSYYVQVGIFRANVFVQPHPIKPFLKTDRDSTTVDNLLSLPECV